MEILRAIRKARGLTQEQLSAELKCAPSLISMMETGERAPGRSLAVRIQRWSNDQIKVADWPESADGEEGAQCA